MVTLLPGLPFSNPLQAFLAVLDVAIVAYVLYRFFLLIRGTRAVQLINGVIILLVAWLLSDWLDLVTVNWLLQRALVMLVVALPIVFQPELRRALEQLGRGRFFPRSFQALGEQDISRLIEAISKAVGVLSRNKVGALIVLERETGLGEVIETGLQLDALVSAEFLVNIFTPNTPLHDGAVIIRGNRAVAAACFLPLTESPDVSKDFGGRHRAALGITEHSDALAVVVSEQTGAISLANAGKLIRNLDEKTLEEMLAALILPRGPTLFQFRARGSA